MNVKIKKLHPNAVIPKYATDGDAGMDLTAVQIIFPNLRQVTYKIGLAMEIPKGYAGFIFPRGSIKHKTLSLSNAVGVVDSGYRGEIEATFNKHDDSSTQRNYEVGDRIAQMIIMPFPEVIFTEVDELSSDTERGTGGFGSTGS